jgi:hypothetical protein
MKYALVLSIVLAAAAPAWADDSLNGLSPEGLGDLKIGTAVDKVEAHLNEKLGYNQYENRGCSVLTTKKLEPTGISVVIDSKVLTRINVDYFGKSPLPQTIKTDKGIGLGSSEEDVSKAYPGARVKPNPGDPSWHTIIVETPDHAKGIVFETDGKTVKSMRAGTYSAIAFADACS